jgi:hypothetical protein
VQVRLPEPGSNESDSTWLDLAAKIGEAIMGSFSHHILQYEDNVRRLDAQRQMPGWNYCTFFLMKASIC